MMEELSANYGWTPSEIRKEKAGDIFTYWDIMIQKRKLAKDN